MVEYEDYKFKLNGVKPELETLRGAMKLDEALAEIKKLEQESEQDGFWNDLQRSQKVQQRLKQLKNKCDKFTNLENRYNDLLTLCEMAIEEDDESLLPELETDYKAFSDDLESARLETMLSGEYDASNAILSFHAGAGGTEAQDWTEMLYRMYTRWAERHGFKYTILDYLDGEEAGIKSATIKIDGENAYGYLKSESGIHRLVRVSPFDASGRRHTSFAAVEVMPEITDDKDIEIR
ncbi:MAG: PCRF domain-containing protein, partial [Oscillospiraceae bacterium]